MRDTTLNNSMTESNLKDVHDTLDKERKEYISEADKVHTIRKTRHQTERIQESTENEGIIIY